MSRRAARAGRSAAHGSHVAVVVIVVEADCIRGLVGVCPGAGEGGDGVGERGSAARPGGRITGPARQPAAHGAGGPPVRGAAGAPRLTMPVMPPNAPVRALEGSDPMSKRGNKRRARKGKKANHGKRPNA